MNDKRGNTKLINIGLKRKLESYDSILIYGTGVYAKKIYPELCELGLREKITSFVVSKQTEETTFQGIGVNTIDNVVCDKQHCGVLIATSVLYENEITEILEQRGFENIIYLSGYVRYRGQLLPYIEGTFETYCEYIADWYIEKEKFCNTEIQKTHIMESLLCHNKGLEQKNEKLIVWLCGLLTPRTIKIISVLKKNGYEIVMLRYALTDIPRYQEEFKKLDISNRYCECVEEMMYYALQYKPLVYVFEPSWSDCSWAHIMLRQKQKFGKFVISLYDVMNVGYVNIPQHNLETERYVLENADGIIWRWFAKDYLAESKGMRYRGKSIQFLDYCAGYPIAEQTQDMESDEVKICLVGGAGKNASDERITQEFDNKGYVWEASMQEILDILGNRKDCCIHFFAADLMEENIKICKKFEEKYSNFKLFLRTDHTQLIEKLSNYDYGCELFTDGKKLPPDMTLNGINTGNDLIYSVANKYFDFFDAGIAVITTYPEKFIDYLEQYGIIVRMNTGNFDVEYLKKNKAKYKENARIAKKELHIDNQIPRLIEFFKDV